MKMIHKALLPILLINTPLWANSSSSKVTSEVQVGAQHDSQINVTELDQTSEQGDNALLFNAKVNGKWQASNKFKVTGGYQYQSKRYQQLDNYDLAIHQLSIDASYDFTAVTLGASHHYADASLHEEGFLTFAQSSVYLGKMLTPEIYLRGAVNRKDKDFDDFTGRNAETLGFSADTFVFFNQAKTLLLIGIANDNEQATDPVFDYSAISFKSQLSNRFQLWGKQSKIQASWRYLQRDYKHINPVIEQRRADQRSIAELEWQLTLTPYLKAVSKIERGNYRSNLDAADYDQTLTSISLQAQF